MKSGKVSKPEDLFLHVFLHSLVHLASIEHDDMALQVVL